jgi:hypothetical protein
MIRTTKYLAFAEIAGVVSGDKSRDINITEYLGVPYCSGTVATSLTGPQSYVFLSVENVKKQGIRSSWVLVFPLRRINLELCVSNISRHGNLYP